jgi:4-aminobutyrate aminotransferase/(S)-3-amino-2-methylpropionate transaminase
MPSIQLVTPVPGPRSLELVARREAAGARGAAKLTQVAVARACGSTVLDVDGNTLLDFAGGIGVLAVGHNHPAVVQALHEQTDALIHLCAIVGTYEPYVETLELLNQHAPGDFAKKSVLLNSGAEAVETAVKISRAHTGRAGIIVFEGAYHGRTNLTLAMTSKYALFKKGFGPFAPEIYRLPFPNPYRRPPEMSEEGFVQYAIEQLENALVAQIDPSAIAAIVIEPVQGEGGFIPVPPRFLQRIRELCTQYGIVMVADEIQCGFGRTGKLFATEHYGVAPDLMTTAKSLAAGMPLAAVTGRAEIMDAPHPGGLGGTYSGNPLACAAAVQAIRTIADPAFLARAAAVGDRFRRHLEAIAQRSPLVGEVRGLGPMLAMEFVRDRESKAPVAPDVVLRMTQETLKRGLITIRAGLYANCLRFLPPLNISDDEIDEGMAIVADAVQTVTDQVLATA